MRTASLFAIVVGVFGLTSRALAAASQPPATPPRPNIILILADDMGFSDVGCYGGEIHTPSIDRLAAEGVRFTQFYNVARCCPTRAALLAGLYPHQAGVGAMNQDLGRPSYRGELNDRCVTIAEALKDGGYQTGMAGKWHLCHLTISSGGASAKRLVNFEIGDARISPSTANWPCNRGFDDHWGTIPGVEDYYDPYGLVHNEQTIRPEGEHFYYTDFITDHSVQMVDRFAAGGKPFFLYVAYTAPHWPTQAPGQDVKRYAETYSVGWDKIRAARFERQVAMGIANRQQGLSPRATYPRQGEGASTLGAWEDAPEKAWQARRVAVYAAMVETMDRGIGRNLDKLRERDLERNTLVIFLSDNGGCAENVRPDWYDVPSKTRDGRTIHVGNDPRFMPGPQEVYQSYGPAWANASNTPFRRFKHWTEEGGISTPFIVRYPRGITQPGRIERGQVGHVIDLMPTVLELAGVTYPRRRNGREVLPPEGKSLAAALNGKPVERGGLFWEYEGNRAVRLGDWKLVAGHGEKWQLYNIANDRTETNDLSGANPDRVDELEKLYTAWAARCGVEH